MAKNTIAMRIPIVESTKRDKGIVPRLSDLDNKVIAVMDNQFVNYVPFADRLKELLSERYKTATVIRGTKYEKGLGLPKEQFEELASKCDAVIEALGS